MTIKIYSFHLTIFKIILHLLWCVFLFFISLFLLDFYLVTHFVRFVRGDIFGLDVVLNSLNEVIIELMFIFFLILTSKKLWLILFLINLINFLMRHNIINCLIRLIIAAWTSYFLFYLWSKLSFTGINGFWFNLLVGNWSCIFFSLILWRLIELRS